METLGTEIYGFNNMFRLFSEACTIQRREYSCLDLDNIEQSFEWMQFLWLILLWIDVSRNHSLDDVSFSSSYVQDVCDMLVHRHKITFLPEWGSDKCVIY